MTWTPGIKSRVVNALRNKARKPCNRCGQDTFEVVDGFFVQMVSEDTSKMPFSTGEVTAIPSIVVVCQKCGALTQHAIGALGINLEEERPMVSAVTQ